MEEQRSKVLWDAPSLLGQLVAVHILSTVCFPQSYEDATTSVLVTGYQAQMY